MDNEKRKDHKLVIVGKKGWMYEEIFATVQKRNEQENIIFTGYVPDEDMPALYSAATCFVYPSHYEGFGIPIVEAMACDCPVITSKNSSMEEIAGEAAILINPINNKEIQEAMEEILSNKKEREKRKKQGMLQVKKFNWDKMAEETIALYHWIG